MRRQTALLLRFDAMKTLMREVENLLIKDYRDDALAAIRVYKDEYGELDSQLYNANRKKQEESHG